MLFCRLLIFLKSTFSKNSFRNSNRASNILDPDQIIFANSLNPDQAGQNVGSDLDPNCLTL